MLTIFSAVAHNGNINKLGRQSDADNDKNVRTKKENIYVHVLANLSVASLAVL